MTDVSDEVKGRLSEALKASLNMMLGGDVPVAV